MAEIAAPVQPQMSCSAPAATSTTLGQAIEQESLAGACIKTLQSFGKLHNAIPGSGIKVLRLVSKQMCTVMTRNNIRGYTLLLDGVTEEVPAVKLLKLAQLSRLHVKVTTDGSWKLSLAHMRQLQNFVTAVGPALLTVSTISVSLPRQEEEYNISELDVASVFSPLAAACPRLQNLKVTGDVGSLMLSAFGRACKNLTCVETVQVPADTLEKLQQLLPHLKSTDMKLVGDDGATMASGDPDDFLLAVSSNSTLTSLYMGVHALTPDMWSALPSSIKHLHAGAYCCSEAQQPHRKVAPVHKQLPNLRNVISICEHIPLCDVAHVLRAAPGLRMLAIGAVLVPGIMGHIPDLLLVNERLKTGDLKVEICFGRYDWHGDGMVLSLEDVEIVNPTAGFVLPLLEHFRSIELLTVERPSLIKLARVFPSIRTLVLGNLVGAQELPNLTAFAGLERVDFSSVENLFSDFDLGALFVKIPSLWHVRLQAPGVKCNKVQLAMQTWGRRVRVEKYHE